MSLVELSNEISIVFDAMQKLLDNALVKPLDKTDYLVLLERYVLLVSQIREFQIHGDEVDEGVVDEEEEDS